jgi:hypothetical protein
VLPVASPPATTTPMGGTEGARRPIIVHNGRGDDRDVALVLQSGHGRDVRLTGQGGQVRAGGEQIAEDHVSSLGQVRRMVFW